MGYRTTAAMEERVGEGGLQYSKHTAYIQKLLWELQQYIIIFLRKMTAYNHHLRPHSSCCSWRKKEENEGVRGKKEEPVYLFFLMPLIYLPNNMELLLRYSTSTMTVREPQCYSTDNRDLEWDLAARQSAPLQARTRRSIDIFLVQKKSICK